MKIPFEIGDLIITANDKYVYEVIENEIFKGPISGSDCFLGKMILSNCGSSFIGMEVHLLVDRPWRLYKETLKRKSHKLTTIFS